MGAFLARELFKVAGFSISPGLIFKVILGISAAVLLWLAYSKVNDHFKHIRQLEAQNTQLQDDKNKLTAQKQELEKINHDNAQVYATELDVAKGNHQIAANERAATDARTQTYGEIRHAIKNAAPSTQPIGPATAAVIDRLWGQSPDPQRK